MTNGTKQGCESTLPIAVSGKRSNNERAIEGQGNHYQTWVMPRLLPLRLITYFRLADYVLIFLLTPCLVLEWTRMGSG